jgi:exopolyphosphatase/guanosine-5'-triphosphate,3'-diphosphate pyrophosphatase
LLKIKEPVKLGEGGISQGSITDAARQRALKTLHDFRHRVGIFKVEQVKAVATSAIRNATNGPDLVQAIKAETGFDIEIISGDREAELIYHGVKSALEIGFERSLIIDIGGGSVEFIICDNDTIFWKQSYEIGAQRLLDKFYITDPITEISVEAEKKYLEEQLVSLTQAVQQFQPTVLMAHRARLIPCVISIPREKRHRPAAGPEPRGGLSLSCFYEIYEDLLRKNREERLAFRVCWKCA